MTWLNMKINDKCTDEQSKCWESLSHKFSDAYV